MHGLKNTDMGLNAGDHDLLSVKGLQLLDKILFAAAAEIGFFNGLLFFEDVGDFGREAAGSLVDEVGSWSNWLIRRWRS